jgi:hypothetical protein
VERPNGDEAGQHGLGYDGLNKVPGGSTMSTPVVIVEGTVKADGTLEVQEKINLPAGKVQVTLVPMPELPKDDPFWQGMQAIWEGQKARGHVPRSAEEVEDERRASRDEMEDEIQEAIRLQEECRKARGESQEQAESGE